MEANKIKPLNIERAWQIQLQLNIWTRYSELLVFSVTPFKIDQNQIKTIRWIKSRIWEMKRGTYTKTLGKIRVRGILGIRDIRRNVLPKLIEICLESPWWYSPAWAPTWRTETNRNICYRVCYKSVNLFFEKLINIKVILFLIHELFR